MHIRFFSRESCARAIETRARGGRRRHLPAAIVAGWLARTVASQRLVIRSQPGSNCYCYAYSSFTRKQNYFGQALDQILEI